MFSSVKVVPLHLSLLTTRKPASFTIFSTLEKSFHDSHNSSRTRNSRDLELRQKKLMFSYQVTPTSKVKCLK